MTRAAAAAGFPDIRATHNAVFATLPGDGGRISVMAGRPGMTKQSMAEIVRDLKRAGIVRIDPNPTHGRAKLVTYTEAGWTCVRAGEQHLHDVEAHLASALGQRRLAELWARRLLRGSRRVRAWARRRTGRRAVAAPRRSG